MGGGGGGPRAPRKTSQACARTVARVPTRLGAVVTRGAAGTPQVGVVTSGTFSPCLKKPVAMGYVATAAAKEGTELSIKVRNKMQAATVTKMPFVETSYYRVPE